MIHDVVATLSEVTWARLVVKSGRLTQQKLVLSSPEWIAKQCHWMQIHIAVSTCCLPSTGAVEVPNGQIFWSLWFEVNRLRLAAKPFPSTIDPNIHYLHSFSSVKVHVLEQCWVVWRHDSQVTRSVCFETKTAETDSSFVSTTESRSLIKYRKLTSRDTEI